MYLKSGTRTVLYTLTFIFCIALSSLGFWSLAVTLFVLYLTLLGYFIVHIKPTNTYSKGVLLNEPPFIAQQERLGENIEASDKTIKIIFIISLLTLIFIGVIKY